MWSEYGSDNHIKLAKTDNLAYFLIMAASAHLIRICSVITDRAVPTLIIIYIMGYDLYSWLMINDHWRVGNAPPTENETILILTKHPLNFGPSAQSEECCLSLWR